MAFFGVANILQVIRFFFACLCNLQVVFLFLRYQIVSNYLRHEMIKYHVYFLLYSQQCALKKIIRILKKRQSSIPWSLQNIVIVSGKVDLRDEIAGKFACCGMCRIGVMRLDRKGRQNQNLSKFIAYHHYLPLAHLPVQLTAVY